jgi:hypothetical protein
MTFQIQAITINEPASGKGVDLKMETTKNKLYTVTAFQEFW